MRNPNGPSIEEKEAMQDQLDDMNEVWLAGKASAQSNLKKAADILTNVCQIIDVVKQEWGTSWSDWDQSVRDGISEWLKQFHGMTCDGCHDNPVVPPAELCDECKGGKD